MFKIFSNKRFYSTIYQTKTISNVLKSYKLGEKLCVKGWVKSLRKMKQNIFLDVSDGSCDSKLQVVLNGANKYEKLTTGASIEVNGILGNTPKGQLELNGDDLHVIGECIISDGYPFAPRKTYPPEYIRDFLHLRSRTNKFASLLRTRHKCVKIIHDYFDSEGFFNIHTPILTSNDCEGAGEVFTVQPENEKLLKEMSKDGFPLEEAYFNTKVFLTVSGQLHLEAIAHGLSKVYTFGPTFRAENSKSRLHLSEFYMLEGEVAFVERVEDLCGIIEKLLKSVTKTTLDVCKDDVMRIQGAENRIHSWIDKSFTIMTYDEASVLLEKNKTKLNLPSDKEQGFTKEQEILLVDLNGGVPVFVINWPKNMKPFYMKSCTEDSSKVNVIKLIYLLYFPWGLNLSLHMLIFCNDTTASIFQLFLILEKTNIYCKMEKKLYYCESNNNFILNIQPFSSSSS